jgi:PEP-CTERM motif
MTKKLVGGLAVVVCLALAQVGPASAGSFGPSPYLSFNDSPFVPLLPSFSYFFLDTFENHLLSTPGVTAVGGQVTSTVPFSGTIIDSVRADGGPSTPCPQASAPNPCDSFFGGNGAAGITFLFDANALGGLPTHVGLVWTDGVGERVTLTVGGPNGFLGTVTGTNLGDGNFFGGTDEDRFFGWSDPAGILTITMTDPGGGIEVDHLQYGRLAPTAVPEPGTIVLLGAGVAALTLRRGRRGSRAS